MFSANAYVPEVLDIPSNWVFETYLGLPPMNGKTVRMRSLFNDQDKTPSMYIFYSVEKSMYLYKCFSTGRSGGCVSLLQAVWGKDFLEVADILRKDYQSFLQGGQKPAQILIKAAINWKVSSAEVRGWTQVDADYWTAYNIGSDLLNEYNVKPLRHYFMKRELDSMQSEAFKVTRPMIYGYFDSKGELYKVYQPETKPKALRVKSHVQGYDQRKRYKTLILTSSLKDILAVKSLKLIKADVFAPDSESVYFTKEQIIEWFYEYEAIVTYMDSDKEGLECMQYYEELYGLPFMYIPLEKDPSDLIKFYKPDRAMQEIIPKLLTATDKYRQNLETIKKKLCIM